MSNDTDSRDLPYLRHIKRLSNRWPHLRLLADFMEVGTTPVRWKNLRSDPEARDRRARKTNVSRLDYLTSGEVNSSDYKTSTALSKALKGESQEVGIDKVHFRLFVVEDLSRDVIEQLGAHLDIQPAFFREHIVDYVWYNARDPWVDPPNFDTIVREQSWLQFRFVTARYFETIAQFEAACKEAESFNVLRRPDDDQNNKTLWDKENAIIGITRARATFWFKQAEGPNKPAVGVLLLDPTIHYGFPLWRGHRNWEPTPSMSMSMDAACDGPPRTSFFNDFIYWSRRLAEMQPSSSKGPRCSIHIPIQALLHLICAEWLTMCEYIKARLGQIEWEIVFPEHLLNEDANVDIALRKLHIWRKLVPLYREMLTETIQRLSDFPCHGTNGTDCRTKQCTSTSGCDPSHCSLDHEEFVTTFRTEFERALHRMEEHQQRIDRLTSVITAVITIADSRRSLTDNNNLARITWLATLFIPLSFVAGLFSMQDDITKLSGTMKWYFAAVIPLVVIGLGLAVTLTLPKGERLSGLRKSFGFARDIKTRANIPRKHKSAV